MKATLTLWMPKIESILTSGGTAALDFTLHDAGHSFRVAQRMAQIIPKNVLPQLSMYELTLLLLAAYLHDIGMTPERGKVEGVYSYLLTGDSKELSADDMDALQAWLDEHDEGVAPFATAAAPTPESLQKARELTTHFCRDRHNHWSAEWIRHNLSDARLGSYHGWLDDLVALCRSHHEEYTELKSDRFDPKAVGGESVIVHLRYSAAALRIADVLDVDPERTPDVILRHRDVSPSSLIYWWKDQQMSVGQEDSRIVITARPQTARMHKAIEMTVEQINHELALCRKLADDTHFEVCPGWTETLPHRWDLEPSAHSDIRAQDAAYEYIDGSFRPDTRKLLQLLSGVELYGSEMVAVRELLQNAFDAVREQIAYCRLDDPDPASPATERKFSEINRVDLRLEFSPDGAWLVCKDTGVGMTKAIIRDHLLVSGVARRHDTLSLERRCKENGFSLSRTGQFGIGVLSYFMLADRVVIKTRRSAEPGDSEPNGWRFETEGVGSFGELRRDTTPAHGTESWLRLRQSGDLRSWYAKLMSYLRSTLIRIPCRFTLNSTIDGYAEVVMGPGFGLCEQQFTEQVASAVRPRRWREETSAELLSTERRKQREQESQFWETISDEIRKQLRWTVVEGSLPDEMGFFRLYLPHFELAGGVSLAFVRPLEEGDRITLEHVGDGYCYVPDGRQIFGWKGMETGISHEFIDADDLPRGNTLCAVIDWVSDAAGSVAVNRTSVSLHEKTWTALKWLDEKSSEMYENFLALHHSSIWSSLNRTVANSHSTLRTPLRWAATAEAEGSSSVTWRVIDPPRLCASSFPYESSEHLAVLWKSKPVQVARCLGKPDAGATYDGPSCIGLGDSPDRIMARISNGFFWGVLPLWVGGGNRAQGCAAGLSSCFPPEWSDVCGVRIEHYGPKAATIWNSENELIRSITLDAWELCSDKFASSLDPIPFRRLLLADRARAASWVLLCLRGGAWELWDGLKDRDESFLPELWTFLFGLDSARHHVTYWVESTTDDRLRVVTPKYWTAIRRRSKIEGKHIQKYMPIPSEDWVLRVEKPYPHTQPAPPTPQSRT